ncbi:hypothetical protein EC973_008929 [Apophysomyces ossiformis]|uniref:Uncharacterized protein n=1 Tax=Apophysomyces ossiformis TaxID=679940 RepID=A0A8H7BKI9_9FUNG|nr:hypothetical protein EC973_008929 [Apophysomyces ossiformis]
MQSSNTSNHTIANTATNIPSCFPSPPTSPENESSLAHKRKRSISSTASHPRKQVKLDISALERYLTLGGSPNVHDQRRGWNLLCWACQSRSEPALKLLLQQGDIDPNASKNGMTALHTAASMGFLAGLNLILQHPHVDLHATNHLGQTAVHCAVQANQQECVLALLEAGARLDIRDRQGRHPLHTAILHRHLPCVQIILDRRGRNNPTNLDMFDTMMEEAVRAGYAPVLELLLRECPERPSHLIRSAVFWNRLECLHLLIQAGCDVVTASNDQDPSDTPLYRAVQQRKLDLVRVLRAAGANPCHRNGLNPSLLYAANHGFLEMIPLLLTNTTSDDCIYQAALLSDSVGRRRQFLSIIQAWKAKLCKSSTPL